MFSYPQFKHGVPRFPSNIRHQALLPNRHPNASPLFTLLSAMAFELSLPVVNANHVEWTDATGRKVLIKYYENGAVTAEFNGESLTVCKMWVTGVQCKINQVMAPHPLLRAPHLERLQTPSRKHPPPTGEETASPATPRRQVTVHTRYTETEIGSTRGVLRVKKSPHPPVNCDAAEVHVHQQPRTI